MERAKLERGPNTGTGENVEPVMKNDQNLCLLKGKNAAELGRNVGRALWSEEEIKTHMISPSKKTQRADFPKEDKEKFRGKNIDL